MRDLGRAHVLVLEALERGEPYQFYNLGTETGHSVREVIECVARVAGRPVPHRVGPRRPGDPPRLVASAAKLRAATGFHLQHGSLEASVETALRWRERHPQGYGARA